MTVYVVKHLYDVDGGPGGANIRVAIPSNEIVALFENEDEAYEFVNKYSDAHTSYSGLSCGTLAISPVETGKYDESKFWWIR